MKVILIDKEQSVLDLLQEKITQLANVEVIRAFTDPHQGLIEVSKQEPNVLFLDISIPEVNWIKVAKQLKKAIPEMKLVFLATVAKYALEAFEIQADDYIVKPVEEERLKRTLSKLTGQIIQAPISKPIIGCFQKLHFRYDDENEDRLNVNWRTSKAREVFSYFIHNREKLVRKDVLVDLFWPDSPLKEAFRQLYSTIYQIRRTLAAIELDIQIINSGNSYRLKLNDHLIDVDMWEEGIKSMPFITAKNVAVHKKLLYLYKGDYFKEENHLWSMNERNRLRVQWMNHMKRVINYYLSIESYEETILLYLYYQKINPYTNDSYFELMKLYALFDDRYAVKEQYQLLKEMSIEEFGKEPDEEIIAWYDKWKKGR